MTDTRYNSQNSVIDLPVQTILREDDKTGLVLKTCTDAEAQREHKTVFINRKENHRRYYERKELEKKQAFAAGIYNAQLYEFIDYLFATRLHEEKLEEARLLDERNIEASLISVTHIEDKSSHVSSELNPTLARIETLQALLSQNISQIENRVQVAKAQLQTDLTAWEAKNWQRISEELATLAEEKMFNVPNVFGPKEAGATAAPQARAKHAFAQAIKASPPLHKVIQHISPIQEAIRHAVKQELDGVPQAPALLEKTYHKAVNHIVDARISLATHIKQIGAMMTKENGNLGIKKALNIGRGITAFERKLLENFHELEAKIKSKLHLTASEKETHQSIKPKVPNLLLRKKFDDERSNIQKTIIKKQSEPLENYAKFFAVEHVARSAISNLRSYQNILTQQLNPTTRAANPTQIISSIENIVTPIVNNIIPRNENFSRPTNR